MKASATLAEPILSRPSLPAEPAIASAGARLAAHLSLTKPRIVTMVLVTVAVGFLLGARGGSHPATFGLTLLGAGLVAGGAGGWNQCVERSRDARMRRTASRALPSGRLSFEEAALSATALTVAGLAILLWGVNAPSAAVAAATFILYVGVYTPLKAATTLNTAIGAIPGALPPVIGWAAATGRIGIEAWALFLIVFLWQFPHFLAIAWIYRTDYRRGGLKMISGVDPSGALTGRQAAIHALALIPAGLLPAVVGLAGPIYFAGALGLGLLYFGDAARFWSDVSDRSARRLLRTSIVYLPAILALLLLNPLPA